eukprot:9512242-Lingulodinium_polyedra.AAC.1
MGCGGRERQTVLDTANRRRGAPRGLAAQRTHPALGEARGLRAVEGPRHARRAEETAATKARTAQRR